MFILKRLAKFQVAMAAFLVLLIGGSVTVPGLLQSDFGTCTSLPQGWSCNHTNGLTGTTSTIINGVLETDLFANGTGNDSNYLWATAQKGTFPWSPCQPPASGVLPDNLATVDTTFTPLILPTTGRYHIYTALYYWLPNGPATRGNATYRCLDTQSRVESIHGVFSPVGKTETYDPSDAFGWDQVTISNISIGTTYTLTANVTAQCRGDLLAWGIDPATPCQLAGIEIGVEGFQFQELNVQWPTVALNSASPPPPPPPPPPPTQLTTTFTYAPPAATTGQEVNFTSTASGGVPPYSFIWDLGDGSSATNNSTSHAYASSGNFTVNLTTTDSLRATASASRTVTITAPVTVTPRPTWPQSSALTYTNLGQASLTLQWTPATSTMEYRIYQGGTPLASIPSTSTSYLVAGLSPGTAYTFKVEAGDAAGSWTSDGPYTTITTPTANPQPPPPSSGSGSTSTPNLTLPAVYALTGLFAVGAVSVLVFRQRRRGSRSATSTP